MLALLATVALAAAPGAADAPVELEPPLVTAEGENLDETGKVVRGFPFIGIQVDAALPDGFCASLVATPGRFLRVHAGALSNGVGFGVRAGVTLVAFPGSPVRPIAGVDGGYTFGGTGAWLVPMLDPSVGTLLSAANIGFVSAQGGVEIGSRYVALVLRGGVTWIDAAVGVGAVEVSGARLSTGAVSVRAFLPSVRLGFLVNFG